MLGTKCPSITSRWIQSAPAVSTARTSSPSLAKSAARIDGAMTRGRDANCWDMCAFPNLFRRADRAPRNMGEGREQCRHGRLLWAEKSAAAGSYCRVGRMETDAAKSGFIGFFVMARRLLRNRHTNECRPPSARLRWSSAMLFALGAASSAINALKALTSSKSSAQTTGVSQNASGMFDLPSSNASASISSGTGSGGSGSTISPETMSALLDAQSQSSGGSGSALKTRHAALKDLFGQIDGDGDGKITKSEFEEALGAGGTNLTQADSVFGKLDADGDGSVSLKELASALRPGKGHHADRDKAGN